ncbi:RNA-directed DNA polymerase, eukaryota [Artemisia annua]|uniref:RNA-directed DNA polymerase, eukaryota n=1 Tax=Artemisia annua TaxID=35608 RepID=A0A2U1LH66_ARTAN|nr:RNA-directed DNA polymerase, eukaryota [Artemisia annua]
MEYINTIINSLKVVHKQRTIQPSKLKPIFLSTKHLMVEEWTHVPTRRNKGKQNQIGHDKGIRDVTKFYVSNFPNGCTPWEVKEFFGHFGEVVGSYIAKKRDKEGNRFGFISFRKVSNVVDMEKRMNGTKMGCFRLKVNIARFAVENVGLKELEVRVDRKQDKHDRPKEWKHDKQEVDWQSKGPGHSSHPGVGLSYRAVLGGKTFKDASPSVMPVCRSIIVPDNVVAFYDIRGRALIGKVRNLKTLTSMKQICEDNLVGGFNIVYAGGLSLLLNFHEKEDAVEMLLNKEVWSKWFSDLVLWEGQAMPFERVAWLKIHGVPINLATDEVYDDISSLFGKIVFPSHLCLDDGDISVGFVGILVGDGKIINDSVDLKWANKVFRTWITEEKGNWEPECVGVVEKKVAVPNDGPVDNDGISSPVKIHDPMTEEVREVNESSEADLEEGELREPMHGEVGDINSMHACSLGATLELAANLSGVDEAEVKCNSFTFNSSLSGPKPNKRHIKLNKKRNQRVYNIIHSPSNIARPKKRSRNEDNDPFDLDRLLGIFHKEKESQGDLQSKEYESPRQSVDGGALDLIRDALAPESLVDGAGETDHVVDEGDPLVQEVEATVAIGAVLGANLAGHEGLVKKVIVNEGLGGLDKVSWLNKLKKENGVDFLAVQETKDESLSKFEGSSIWGNKNFGLEFVGSTGQSGGILSMWDKGRFLLISSSKARNYLLVSGRIKGSNELVNIINVYAPQGVVAKCELWGTIESLVSSLEGMWIILGDFNAVRFPDERMGSVFKSSCARNFNSFIHNAGLLEYSLNGRKLSKIDRVLVCNCFFNKWPDACLRVLSGSNSDHFPLLLTTVSKNFGPKPFRVFNSWLSKDGFEDVVSSAAGFVGDSVSPDVNLMKKFGRIRDSIKIWKEEMLKKESVVVEEARMEIEKLEVEMESRELEEYEEWIYSENKMVLKDSECRGGLLKNVVFVRSFTAGMLAVFRSPIRSWDFLPVRNNLNGVWSNIVKVLSRTVVSGLPLRRFFKGKVGNGIDTSFWIDPWILNVPLMVVCPNLFRVDSDKRCKVSDRLVRTDSGISRVWNWKRSVSEVDVRAEMDVLNSLLDAAVLSDAKDCWGWIGIGNGVFSVKAVRELMYVDMDFSNNSVYKWCKWIPKKCNIFGWRAEMGRIPTACALRHRNIQIVDASCVFCGDAEETVDHLFTGCILASRVWQHISSWCKVKNFFAFSFKDLLDVHNFVGLSGRAKYIFYGIIIIGCWCIWRARNHQKFLGKKAKFVDIIGDIKVLGFLWVKNRAKVHSLNWDLWSKFVIM